MPSVTPVTACAAVKPRSGITKRPGANNAIARPSSNAPNSHGEGTPARSNPHPPRATTAATRSQGRIRRTQLRLDGTGSMSHSAVPWWADGQDGRHERARRRHGADRAGRPLRRDRRRPRAASGAYPPDGHRRRGPRRRPRRRRAPRARGQGRSRRLAEHRRADLARDRRRRARRHGRLPAGPPARAPQPPPRRRLPRRDERRGHARPPALRGGPHPQRPHLDAARRDGRSGDRHPRPRRDQGVVPPDRRRARRPVPRHRARPARLRRVGQAARRAPTTPASSPSR